MFMKIGMLDLVSQDVVDGEGLKEQSKVKCQKPRATRQSLSAYMSPDAPASEGGPK